MLRQRVASAAVVLPVLFAAIWFGNPWFSVAAAVVAVVGVIEFYAMAAPARWQPLTFFGTLWTLLFIFNAYCSDSYGSETTQLLVTSALVTSAIAFSLLASLFARPSGDKLFTSWAWTLAGVFYVGWLLSHWVLMMTSFGREWVLLALFSTFAVDTSAYFVGRAFGRRKLAPSISPAKTWEGAVGGLLGGLAAPVILALIMGIEIGYGKILFIGLMVGLFAQLGDLAESKLKRSTGVKESGSLIPGHGGILDRLDSVVFTGVVVYYCLRWFLG